jgi:hypothetical protein
MGGAPMDLMMQSAPLPFMAQNAMQQQFNNLYKTQLCKHFMQTKHCHVGSKCHFAHGEHELRKPNDVSIILLLQLFLFLQDKSILYLHNLTLQI